MLGKPTDGNHLVACYFAGSWTAMMNLTSDEVSEMLRKDLMSRARAPCRYRLRRVHRMGSEQRDRGQVGHPETER